MRSKFHESSYFDEKIRKTFISILSQKSGVERFQILIGLSLEENPDNLCLRLIFNFKGNSTRFFATVSCGNNPVIR